MATDEDAQVEVERRLRDIGARLASLPASSKELFPLVEEAELWLSRVDQSPPSSMHDALKPAMDALVSEHLLKHPSQDIKVAVACCLTEVTRITAPEPPYADDVMRDVFTVVVESFAELDVTESFLFAKRVSMLETVAKVRSCVLMLDLECDDLILDAFNHFFDTISSTHQDNVITSMETIMMYVIQESEPVHSELASCLLQHLKKEKKDSLPASFMLAERIVGLCHEKLKPAFIELLQGTPLNDYSEAVASLVEGSSDAEGDDGIDAVGEDTVADKKASEIAVSDESPQESSRSEKGVNSPEQDGSPPYSTPAASLRNGGASVDNLKPPNGSASSKQKPEMPSDVKQTEVSDEVISDDKESPEPVTTEPEKLSGVSSKNSKLGTSIKSKLTERSKVVSDNKGLVASGELSTKTKVGNNKRTLENCNRDTDDTSKPVDSTPAVDKPKRGRPPAVKSQEKKPVGKSQGSGLESKEVRSASTSRGRPAGRLAKDMKLSQRKTGAEESSKKQPKGSSNLREEDSLSDEDTDENLNLKEKVSPKSLTKTGKNKGQAGDSGVSTGKRVQEVEEVPQSKKNKVLGESLVGSRIKVWWPDDEEFYNGVVESFDASLKKPYKVVYDDGDVEQLQLGKEEWDFIAEEQDMNPNATSEMSRGRRGRGRGNWGPRTKAGKAETPKSSKQDSIEDGDLSKKRGRPKGVHSSMSNDDSPVTSAKSKAKNAEKDAEETPKAGSNLKTGGGRWPRSSGKASNKDEAGSKHKGSNGLSTKRKPKEQEVESSEEEPEEPESESPKASTGKKHRRKSLK